MPLDANAPPARLRSRLDSFDHAVRGRGDYSKLISHARDRLMMDGIHIHPRDSERSAQSRFRGQLDRMRARIARVIWIMIDIAGTLRREVLHQRSAQRYIEHLCAAAYGEERLPSPLCSMDQSNLPAIPDV